MQLSLSKLPWYAQIGAFVVVCLGAVVGFWYFYVLEVQSDLAIRRTRLTALRGDVTRDILRRLQALAAQSSLSIQRFTPQPSVQQAMYAEVPFKLQAEGTYHNLGAFFDRISRFPRIINISSINIKANPKPEPNSTIIAECIATTFVLQEGVAAGKGKATVPKQPSVAK